MTRPVAARSSDRVRRAATSGAGLLTAAGGAMDAWVYLAHGNLFANAQTGNVVLLAIDIAAGRFGEAAHIVPSIAAFIAGLAASSLAGARLKMAGVNSRNLRLSVESVGLFGLASLVARLPDHVVAAWVGLAAAIQITSLSHIGKATFNTGMTTGNLRGGVSAAIAAWLDPAAHADRERSVILAWLCLAFPAGALLGACCTHAIGDRTAFVIAGLVAGAGAVMWKVPDPIAWPTPAPE